MTISEMLGQSALLTGLGICVVFSFLIILILAMNLLHVIVHALHLDKDLQEKKDNGEAKADNKAVVAAIAAAIKEKESQ